jgi:hypothetical protein
VNSGHFTIRKARGVEARRLMRILVEPEADRVLWLHTGVLLVVNQTNAEVSASNALADSPSELRAADSIREFDLIGVVCIGSGRSPLQITQSKERTRFRMKIPPLRWIDPDTA